MSESTSTRDLIDRLFRQSGIKKKLAGEILHAIPEIIEEGLKKDGEVRIKGLGTFRLKLTAGRTGRNPKTGEMVEIPPHNRVVFLPEQSLKEFINRDNRLLSYKVIPEAEPESVGSWQLAVGSQEEEVNSQQSAVSSQQHVLRTEPEGSAVSSQQLAVGSQQSEDRSQKTEDSVQSSKFKVQSEDSNTRNLESGTRNLEPGTRNEEPGTRNEEPGTRNEEPEIDYSYEPEPEKPARKHIHWIIPTVILVIIGLSIAFYFRNFNPVLQKKTEDRRQKAYIVTKDSSKQSAVGGQQSAVGGQQSAVGGQQSAVSSQQSAVGGQQSAVSSQQSAVGGQQRSDTLTQNSELRTLTQNPELRTQNSEGKHLFQLARETYGNPFLWVLIYKSNLDKIPNPDVVISNVELVIPVLEGKPRKLSHNDSLEVAEGYRLVYEYYLGKGNPKAEEFRQAYERYKP